MKVNSPGLQSSFRMSYSPQSQQVRGADKPRRLSSENCRRLYDSPDGVWNTTRDFVDFTLNELIGRTFYRLASDDRIKTFNVYVGSDDKQESFPVSSRFGSSFDVLTSKQRANVVKVLNQYNFGFSEAGIDKNYSVVADPRDSHIIVGRIVDKGVPECKDTSAFFSIGSFSFGDGQQWNRFMIASCEDSFGKSVIRHEFGHVQIFGHPHDFKLFQRNPDPLTCDMSEEKLRVLLLQKYLCDNSDMMYDTYCRVPKRDNLVGAFEIDTMALVTSSDKNKVKLEITERMFNSQMIQLEEMISAKNEVSQLADVVTSGLMICLLVPAVKSIFRHGRYQAMAKPLDRIGGMPQDNFSVKTDSDMFGAVGQVLSFTGVLFSGGSEYLSLKSGPESFLVQMGAFAAATLFYSGIAGSSAKQIFGNGMAVIAGVGAAVAYANNDKEKLLESMVVGVGAILIGNIVSTAFCLYSPKNNPDLPIFNESKMLGASEELQELDTRVGNCLNLSAWVPSVMSLFSADEPPSRSYVDPIGASFSFSRVAVQEERVEVQADSADLGVGYEHESMSLDPLELDP